MTEAVVDPAAPPWLHLLSAFLAMEPPDSLISLARECGGGSVTERVQRFIWNYCITEAAEKGYAPYLKKFLKRLIAEVESNCADVLDEIYEQYAYIMTSLKDDHLVERNVRIRRCISFLFPEGCFNLPSCPKLRKLMAPLQCSLNILEGDTGCSIWPSSLFLSEFILSFPKIFSNKSCFEVGSGVGLVGICLAHVKASKVILTDGDPSTLANMRSNLELNQLRTETESLGSCVEDPSNVKCIHLPWESASESEVCGFMPEIILGADVIYDPQYLPHLVRVLAILLNKRKSYSQRQKESHVGSIGDGKCVDDKVDVNDQGKILQGPVAYIASVIRNIDTFNCFLELGEQANLTITDITERSRPINLLPYMQSYERSSIRLFTVS